MMPPTSAAGLHSGHRVTRVPSGDAAALDALRGLFREYAATIGPSGCFRTLDDELARLDDVYGPPGGLWLASDADGTPLGGVALRALDSGRFELKRLYVRERARGARLGEALLGEALGAVREAGGREVVLDTLPSMAAAQALYARAGFRERPPYGEHPPGARVLGLTFGPPAP